MTSDICPCCGRPVPVNETLVIDPAGIVICNGRVATLTRQETSLLMALHDVRGRVRSREQMLSDLYWQEADEPDIKIIDVFICKMRKRLYPLGVRIETVWGRGYRLSLNSTRENAA